MRKSRPVLIIFAILAGLQFLTAGAALGDVVGGTIAAFIVLIVAAVQGGMSYYVQGMVIPVGDSVAYINQSGEAVAGPAAGVTNGAPVVVAPDPNRSAA